MPTEETDTAATAAAAAATAVVEPPAAGDAAAAAAAATAVVEPPAAGDAAAATDEAAAVVEKTAEEKLAELQATLEAKDRELAAKDFRHTVERAGVTDPDALEVIEHFYSKLAAPEGGQKPTLAEYLADRAKLPKAVLAYLPAAGAGAGAGGAAAAAAADEEPVVLPDANRGARAAPAGGQFTAGAITSMIGNVDVYAANRDAIMERLGARPKAGQAAR